MRKIFLICLILTGFLFSSSINSILKDRKNAVSMSIGSSQWINYKDSQSGYALEFVISPFTVSMYNWGPYQGAIVSYNKLLFPRNIFYKTTYSRYINSNNDKMWNNISIGFNGFKQIYNNIELNGGTHIDFTFDSIGYYYYYDSWIGLEYSINSFSFLAYTRGAIYYNKEYFFSLGLHLSYRFII